MATTRQTKRFYTVARERWEQRHEEHTTAIVTFLLCTRYGESPSLNGLAEHAGILQSIGKFAAYHIRKPKPRHSRFLQRVQVGLCTSDYTVETEGVWVEKLCRMETVDTLRLLNAGSLHEEFFLGNSVVERNLPEAWMRDTGSHTFTNDDEDGSYWNEAQLRAHFREYLDQVRACRMLDTCCRMCYALPQDTIFWEESEGIPFLQTLAGGRAFMGENGEVTGTPQFYGTGYRTLSQEEMEDRGFCGFLSLKCELQRGSESLDEEDTGVPPTADMDHNNREN